MNKVFKKRKFETRLEGALYCLSIGLKVFPLKRPEDVKPGETLANVVKEPAVKGWQEWARTCTPEKVKAYGIAHPTANWGIFWGASGHMALDADNKKGKQGSKELDRLQSENSPLPITMVISTPSNGFHYALKGLCQSRTDAIAIGLDIKSVGGYTVAPGSKIGDKVYEIICDAPIVEAPQWLLRLAENKKEPLARPDDSEVESSISVGSRNTNLTRWAGVLRGQGLTTYEMEAALQAINEIRCDEPLPASDVSSIAESIGKKPRGDAQIIADFYDIADAQKMREENDWPIEIMDFKLGMAKKRRWVIKDWLPEGEISSLYGAGSAGKSLLSLQLGAAAQMGGFFLGMKVENPMLVIGIFCEDSQDELHRRLDDIRNTPEYSFAEYLENKFFLWPRVGKDSALVICDKDDVRPGPFMPKLKAFLSTLPKDEKKLLILDTLSDVYMGDEIAREKVNKFMKVYMTSLIQEFNATLLLLAHPSRTGQSTGDLLSGSTAWENAVRNRLGVSKEGDASFLVRLKSNYAAVGEKIRITYENGRFIPVGDGDTKMEAMEREALSNYLFNFMKPNEERSIQSIVEDIDTDKQFSSFFQGIKSDKHKKKKLIRLLKCGLQKETVSFVYVHREKACTKHLVFAKSYEDAFT